MCFSLPFISFYIHSLTHIQLRSDGVSEVGNILARLESSSSIIPHLGGVIDLFLQLTDDANVQISLQALDVCLLMCVSVLRLSNSVAFYLSILYSQLCLCSRIGKLIAGRIALFYFLSFYNVTNQIQLLGQLSSKVGWPVLTYLDKIINRVVPLLGDSKAILRQAIIKVWYSMITHRWYRKK